MLSIFTFLKTLFARLPSAASTSADDAYLGESVDIYDLERRMRALDDLHRNPGAGIAFGLYVR